MAVATVGARLTDCPMPSPDPVPARWAWASGIAGFLVSCVAAAVPGVWYDEAATMSAVQRP